MTDRQGRDIDYMRISITDRCNLRCRYCMPDGIEQVPMNEILTYEEIVTISEAAAELGITKLKITGGEPLVRIGCGGLIRQLKEILGIQEVTMTTNGILLGQYLEELLDAGLNAVNISIDTLDEEQFRYITGGGELHVVMESLDQAIASGIKVKVNCLLQKNFNENMWKQFIRLADEKNIDVRFIEMMPIGYGRPEQGISNKKLLAYIRKCYPGLTRDVSRHGNGPAVYYRIPGNSGSIGFISAIHGTFCDSCNRIRLTAMGKVKPCLCYAQSVDLKSLMDGDVETSRIRVKEALREAIWGKPSGHCFCEAGRTVSEEMPMVQIGG